MKVYGLTGAPGCGKSTVLDVFKNIGWNCFDADGICRRLHQTPGGELHRLMRERWGISVVAPDGTTLRGEVAKIVFADGSERQWLEDILLPLISREAERLFGQSGPDSDIMFEVPLLFERRWNLDMAGTIAVWSSPEVQMRRLLGRGWPREHCLARMNSQFSADKKLELADYGIINSGSIDELKKQCLELNLQIQENHHGK